MQNTFNFYSRVALLDILMLTSTDNLFYHILLLLLGYPPNFNTLGNSEITICEYQGQPFLLWFIPMTSVEHVAKGKLSSPLHRIYMLKKLLCMPKTEQPRDNKYMENFSYLYSAHSLEVTVRMGYNYSKLQHSVLCADCLLILCYMTA